MIAGWHTTLLRTETCKSVQYVERMLLYQIADLHRMATGGQLGDPYRNFGLASSASNYWYNFETVDFLECAAAGLASQPNDDVQPSTPEWSDMADLLWLGQHYE
jgi:hypothetical protein